MNQSDMNALEAAGWALVTLLPLAIRHEDGSYATLNAAKLVVESVMENAANAPVTKLLADIARLEVLVDKAQCDSSWAATYTAVFVDELASAIREQAEKLKLELDWYDPDSSYEDDVLAFYRAAVLNLKPQAMLLSSTTT